MHSELASNFTEIYMSKNKYMQKAYITNIIYDIYIVKSLARYRCF